MGWVGVKGKQGGVWVDPPWLSNPKFKEEMMALGKGPATWYRFNTWEIQCEQIGNRTFKVGEGTNAFEIPDYSATDVRKQIAVVDSIIKGNTKRKKIWSETEGLLCNPLDASYSSQKTFSGSWVTRHDVNLQARMVEILGIIDANPGIRITQIALVYNTSGRNIRRIFMIANAAGVQFSRISQGRARISNYGIFDKAAIKKLYNQSSGLAAIISKVKYVFDDVTDERTGKVKISAVKKELKHLWEARLLATK